MLFRFYRPASRRNFVAFGAGSLAVFWLISALPWTPVSAHAHEGHDDVVPAGNAAKGLPGLAVKSETYELVAMLDGERLTIYLDRYEDNSPVPNANISILIDAETVAAEPTSDGTYLVQSKLFLGSGSVELVFDIKAREGDALLVSRWLLPSASSTKGASNEVAWYTQPWLAVRHGAQDHLVLLALALAAGLAVGLAIRRLGSRVVPLLALILTVIAFAATSPWAQAHEGHDHPDDPQAKTVPASDTARRLADGTIYVPKPMQRILDVRTVIAKSDTTPRSLILVGRVITDPNRSGVVQSINGGRITAPGNGFPRLGQSVAKGDVLTLVEPAMSIADRTTISERAGEFEQLIAVTEAKLKRLRQLAERGVALQSLVVEAEIELEGLRRRREVIRATRVEPEALRAPIDGVVAISRVVSGQVVQAQDLLFQIVDPTALWVEAYDYGNTDPSNPKQATAAGLGTRPMKLAFQGWGRTLQQQATIVQFAIVDPPAAIRVGQPVSVSVQQQDTVMGILVSRDAVVRASNGEMIIWRHIEPEQFEARRVRTEPFDAERLIIVAGAAEGDRIVVRGAEMINQIR